MAKGGAFERKIAKKLSLWLTGGRDKYQLTRSELSGGWVGARESSDGWQQIGDLASNGEEGRRFRSRFATELKHHKEIDFWWHFTRKPSKYTPEGWWRKLLGEIEECSPGLEPLLIFRANNRPLLVGGTPRIILPTQPERAIVLGVDGLPDIHLIPLDDFLTQSPDFYYHLLDG